MTGIRVAFRMDAGPEIGGGHAMRCLSLARVLRDRGAQVAMFARQQSVDFVPALAVQRDISCHTVDGGPDADCRAIITAFDGPADILVLDSYAFGAGTETTYRRAALHITTISDAPDRRHDCDLIIDPTLGREPEDYAAIVQPRTRCLTGADYAILAPEFARARVRRCGKVEEILIAFGMTDPESIAFRAARAVTETFPELRVMVAIGADATSRVRLGRLAGNVSIAIAATNMVELMTRADIAIGAGGTTAWERCCLGLPSVICVIAENQRANLAALVASGAALEADARSGAEASIIAALSRLIRNPALRDDMARHASALVDGRGADRIAEVLLALPQLRPVDLDDMEAIFAWRNDPGTRRNSLTTESVSWADHETWFKAALADSRRRIFLAEDSAGRLGIVRFDRDERSGDTWHVSITIAPDRRGGGLGRWLLATACRVMEIRHGACALLAEVKAENRPSIAIFSGCGFVEMATPENAPALAFRREAGR